MECPIEVVPGGMWAYCLCVFSFALFQVKLHEMHAAEDHMPPHMRTMNSRASYTLCPCCGYDTVSDDTDDTAKPELCSDCEESGCHHDGSDPQPGCPAFVDDSEIGLGTEYIARAPGECFETGARYKVVAVYDGRMDLECAALDTTVAGVRIDDPALERVPRA